MSRHQTYTAGPVLLIVGGIVGIQGFPMGMEDLPTGRDGAIIGMHAAQTLAMLLLAWTGLWTMKTGTSQARRWPLMTACLLLLAAGVAHLAIFRG